MENRKCPKCGNEKIVKSGVIKGRQRFKCKNCGYFFTVDKIGKEVDSYIVIKALQLYIEGVSYREIERLLGVSHVSVMNWVRKFNLKKPQNHEYRPTYKILTHSELIKYLENPSNMQGSGLILSELGDKYMMIKWERFRD